MSWETPKIHSRHTGVKTKIAAILNITAARFDLKYTHSPEEIKVGEKTLFINQSLLRRFHYRTQAP